MSIHFYRQGMSELSEPSDFRNQQCRFSRRDGAVSNGRLPKRNLFASSTTSKAGPLTATAFVAHRQKAKYRKFTKKLDSSFRSPYIRGTLPKGSQNSQKATTYPKPTPTTRCLTTKKTTSQHLQRAMTSPRYYSTWTAQSSTPQTQS